VSLSPDNVKTLVKVTINGREVEVEQGTNLIEVAKSIGVEIPHWCYHPGLSIEGICRMCLVEVEGMRGLPPACNLKAADGMVVRTDTEAVKRQQRMVMEWLLINHPLDCPICDQAGECRLQEYYMEYGQYRSRFTTFPKVHKGKHFDIGADIVLDQERCVLCTRCVRFCEEVAGVHELTFAQRGNHGEITTFPGRKVQNPYAGNVVDICPVGALTSKDFRFRKRVWYLQTTPSVCTTCARGCNVKVQHSDGRIYRMTPRENQEVNRWWVCDEGRYSYRRIYEHRLSAPTVIREGKPTEVTWESGMESLAESLKATREVDGTPLIAFVATPQATNEELYLFSRIAREGMGCASIYGVNLLEEKDGDDILRRDDRNPNSSGMEILGYVTGKEARDAIGRATLVVLLGAGRSDRKAEEVCPVSEGTFLAVFSTHRNEWTERADLSFPSAEFAEKEGTVTNFQGRVQRLRRAVEPDPPVLADWEGLLELAAALHMKLSYESPLEIFKEMREEVPAFSELTYDRIGNTGASLKAVEAV
jgi:NADH-quinone oxidoreductase subunit G